MTRPVSVISMAPRMPPAATRTAPRRRRSSPAGLPAAHHLAQDLRWPPEGLRRGAGAQRVGGAGHLEDEHPHRGGGGLVDVEDEAADRPAIFSLAVPGPSSMALRRVDEDGPLLGEDALQQLVLVPEVVVDEAVGHAGARGPRRRCGSRGSPSRRRPAPPRGGWPALLRLGDVPSLAVLGWAAAACAVVHGSILGRCSDGEQPRRSIWNQGYPSGTCPGCVTAAQRSARRASRPPPAASGTGPDRTGRTAWPARRASLRRGPRSSGKGNPRSGSPPAPAAVRPPGPRCALPSVVTLGR